MFYFHLVKVPKPYPDNRYELGAIVRNLNGILLLLLLCHVYYFEQQKKN